MEATALWRPHASRRLARGRERLPDVLIGAALVVGAAAIAYFGRFWSFFYDEWGTIFYRRTGALSAFLAPHNGHLQAAVIVLYRVLFAAVGLRSYHPYQAVMLVAHVTLMALVYVYCRRRVGGWTALLMTLSLLLLAQAWQVLFWAVNLGFVFPLIALMALLLWRHPALTAAALILALISSGLGVAIAAGALILVLSEPHRKPHLIAWAAPILAYVAWWFTYRPSALPPAPLRAIPGASPTGDVGSISFPSANLTRAPGYVANSARAAANALAGVQPGGWWMIAAIAALIIIGLALRRRLGLRVIALLATALVFWLETALARGQFSPQSTGASRYLYPGAVLLVLILAEAWDRISIPWPAVALLAIGVGFALAADVRTLHRFSSYARTAFAEQAALLRRAQCDPRLPASLALDPSQAPGVTVGPYLAAVRALGSPPDQACRPSG